MTTNEFLAALPLLMVIGLALAVVVLDMVVPDRDDLVSIVAVAGLVLTLVVIAVVGPLPGAMGLLPADGLPLVGGVYVRDQLTMFLDLLFVGIAILSLLFAVDYLKPRGLPMAEFSTTLLFAISGAMLLGGARDLLIIFIGLELLVLPGYMLAGYAKRDGLSTEGAIKYFLLGSFSSAIFLFGLAFVLGYAGSTDVGEIAAVLASVAAGEASLAPGLAMGLALLTTGVAFKIAAVPFHYWTPDAYQGSPTPVTGYLSVGPKVAAFALILRLFVEGLGPLKADWLPFIFLLAAVTMTLGNLVAITQDNIKRMLAYSSIAHTGYIMVGLAAFAAAPVGSRAETQGLEALLFYSAAYAFMNLGAFACVAALQRRPGVTSQISSFAGLGRRVPLLGLAMVLFLLSLTGIPPLAGFFAKAYVILAAVEVGGWVTWLAVLMMLNAAAAAFYYLRVVVYMYMRDAPEGSRSIEVGAFTRAGLIIAAALTIVIGLVPPVTTAVIDMAREAAQALL
ncbi:MAG: NADH-quinone oxidoreductase subunit N [Chloroflexota bacterium]|nr:NADH-quinone oxidoreductase subunit N [Chloroflexota bacterium]